MPLMGSITSLHNPRIRACERIKSSKRDRYRAQQYVVEGYRLVHHGLLRGHCPALAFYTEEFAVTAVGGALIQELGNAETLVWQVPREVMNALADTVTPQGIVAVMPMVRHSEAKARQAVLVLVVDGLREPGNLGTILRTAQATGVEAVICAPGTVDPYSPKVVRSAMGAHFDLPLFADLSWGEIAGLVQGKRVLAASADGEAELWDAELSGPLALIVGSEAHGLSQEARTLAQETVRIPMVEAAESLNAAIAAAAFLFEAQRQRRRGPS